MSEGRLTLQQLTLLSSHHVQRILYECSFSYVKNMERVHQDLMRDVTELQQQLQSSSQQLRRKEAELTRAEETIRREQQLVQAKDRELAQAQQQLRQQVIFIIQSTMRQELTVNIGLLSVSLCTGAVQQEGDW